MKETIIYTIANVNEEQTTENNKKLNEYLRSVGGKVKIKDVNGVKLLLISFDEGKYHQKTNRYAGRPEKYLKKPYTLGEIRIMRSKMTAQELANKLGISRKTLYRKLDKYKKDNDELKLF